MNESSVPCWCQGTDVERDAEQRVTLQQQELEAGKAALRRVEQNGAAAARPQAESAIEAKLREGIAKFRFDDTAGSSHGEEGTTHSFSP